MIEDAAQAFGAASGRGPVGGLGAIAAFSFFPTKNLGALGDAGLVTTRDVGLAERVRRLRQHGAVAKYRFEELGGNFRLDALQAAFLREKLPSIDAIGRHRRVIAARYVDGAKARGLDRYVGLPPLEPPGQVFHQVVFRTPHRDALAEWLRGRGVETAVHYPAPLHIQSFLGRHRLPEGSHRSPRSSREPSSPFPSAST